MPTERRATTGGWFLRHLDGTVEGPLESRALLRRVDHVPLAGLHVAEKGDPRWRPIQAVPAFAAALARKGVPRPAVGGGSPAVAARDSAATIPDRGVAPTLVGGAAPASGPARDATVYSQTEGSSPGVVAVPLPGARRGRGRRRWVAAAVCLLGGAAFAAGYGLLSPREGEPLAVVVVESSVELADRESRSAGPFVEERARLVVRTAPGALVRVGDGPAVVADADGRVELEHAFERTRERSITLDVRAELGEQAARREGRVGATVVRPARFIQRGAVAECSVHPCALGVEADGRLTLSGIDAGATVAIGGAVATGELPEYADELLSRLDPSALTSGDGPAVTVPLRLTLADGAVYEGEYALDEATLRYVLVERMRQVEDGPVDVPGDEGGAAILWIGGADGRATPGSARLVGEAHSASAIGRVALVSARAQQRSCGRYGRAGQQRQVVVEQRHARVTVYDRRRGRVARAFTVSAPRPPCPAQIQLPPGEGDVVSELTTPELDDVARRLARL